MIKRLGSMALVGMLAVIVLAACGEEDTKVEPTVTRVPASNVPVVTPTTGPGSSVASPAGQGSLVAASPAASPSSVASSPVAASPEASPVVVAASPTANVAATGAAVDLADIKFLPKEITIPANTDVTISLTNKGAATHNFNIDDLNVHSGDLKAGGSGMVVINAAPGTYQYYCNIPGHKETGMVGTLIVQ